MAKRKMKFDIMRSVQAIGLGAAGGVVGDMVTTEAATMLVKSNPTAVQFAPAITSIIGIIGHAFTERGTMLNDALAGVGIIGGVETVQGLLAKTPTAPPSGNGDDGNGTDNGNVDGRQRFLDTATKGNNIFRINGGMRY